MRISNLWTVCLFSKWSSLGRLFFKTYVRGLRNKAKRLVESSHVNCSVTRCCNKMEPNFPNVGPKEAAALITLKVLYFITGKNVTKNLATFSTKIVVKNFQKSPNLFTLTANQIASVQFSIWHFLPLAPGHFGPLNKLDSRLSSLQSMKIESFLVYLAVCPPIRKLIDHGANIASEFLQLKCCVV